MNKYHLQGAAVTLALVLTIAFLAAVLPGVIERHERERVFPVRCTYAEYTREGLERVERTEEHFIPKYLYCEDEYDFGVMKVLKSH